MVEVIALDIWTGMMADQLTGIVEVSVGDTVDMLLLETLVAMRFST